MKLTMSTQSIKMNLKSVYNIVTVYNRNCTIDRTAPQIYELIINVLIQNTVSTLPNITFIGVLQMRKT